MLACVLWCVYLCICVRAFVLDCLVFVREYVCVYWVAKTHRIPKLQNIFHKRTTKSRSLLRKITYKDKGSYESSPPCIVQPLDSPLFCLLCPQVDIPMNFFPGRWVQCVDVCCSVLPWERECRDVLHCFAVCSVLLCVAVSCSVLQCVAVYCCRPRRSPRRGWSTVRSVL